MQIRAEVVAPAEVLFLLNPLEVLQEQEPLKQMEQTDKIQIPIAFLGRLHPLVLHLPIGFGVFLVLIFVLKKWIDAQAFQEIFRFLLYLTSIFSAISIFFWSW